MGRPSISRARPNPSQSPTRVTLFRHGQLLQGFFSGLYPGGIVVYSRKDIDGLRKRGIKTHDAVRVIDVGDLPELLVIVTEVGFNGRAPSFKTETREWPSRICPSSTRALARILDARTAPCPPPAMESNFKHSVSKIHGN